MAPPPITAPPSAHAQSFANAIFTDMFVFLLLWRRRDRHHSCQHPLCIFAPWLQAG